MEKLIDSINNRISALRKAIRMAERAESSFPSGKLRISKSKGYMRYYVITESKDTHGQYINNNSIGLAYRLAQKDYTKDFLKKARVELKTLETAASKLTFCNADLAFSGISVQRQKLVDPYIPDDERYALEWEKKDFRTNGFREEEKKYDTKHGERVRSKSEAILADIFFELDIPYHYEPAVKLKGGLVRYPDFSLLKKSTREVYYLEHFGLLDDEEYRIQALTKLSEYNQNNIVLGKNLLITYEFQDHPLNIKEIRNMLRNIFP